MNDKEAYTWSLYAIYATNTAVMQGFCGTVLW